jgi:hypothetical protein
MPEWISLLLTQGPLGIIAGLFLWLYLLERKRGNKLTTDHAKELMDQREAHFQRLDGVRQAQISREQEVARTLDEYGRSVVIAIDQTSFLANEIRRKQNG